VAEWLAALDVPQYLVDPHGAWLDPARSATTVVVADPTSVCTALAQAGPSPAPPGWLEGWRRAEAAAQAALDDALSRLSGLNEPGVVSSALGVAAAWPGPTTALMGDLAFLHDVNGLLSPPSRPSPGCALVVVDNDGGGIFSFLPQASELAPHRFEELLGTPHGLDLCAVARAHGAEAEEASTTDELVDLMDAGHRRGGVSVMVVRTDRGANVGAHDELHRAVAEAVTAATAGRRPPAGLAT
jgi:2-succinyl-5-enolpyruvyl-6-hydroxy-3-cyclohexene-1-carboxylate synthase